MDQTTIAAKFGVQKMAVTRWKRRGAPVNDPAALAQWILSQPNMQPVAVSAARAIVGGQVQTHTADEVEADNLTQAKLLKTKQEIANLRLKNQVLAGQFIHVDRVREDFLRIGGGWRTRLQGLPSRLAPLLVGQSAADIERMLRDEIDGLVRWFWEQGRNYVGEDER
jgi:phage terminase Nu1 subunit (DNA packaging protein)